MRKTVNKAVLVLLVVSLLISAVSAVSFVSADSSTNVNVYENRLNPNGDQLIDYYEDAPNGSLLYNVNFKGDNYWMPSGNHLAFSDKGDTSLTAVTNETGSSVTLSQTAENVNNYWGGEIWRLPINNGDIYTITFNTSRTYNKAASTLGVLVGRRVYGMQINNAQIRLNKGGGKINDSYNWKDLTSDIPGAGVANAIQSWALEVDAVDMSIKAYALNSEGKWVKQYETESGLITTFGNDTSLHITFVQLAVTDSVTVSDMNIYKGAAISNDYSALPPFVIPEAGDNSGNSGNSDGNNNDEGTPSETKPPKKEYSDTTKKNNDTEVTENTPEDTSASEEKGCGSVLGCSVAVIAITSVAGAMVIKKKKDN